MILTPLLQRAGCQVALSLCPSCWPSLTLAWLQAQLGLSQKPSVSVELQDPFTNNVVNVVLRAKNEVHVTLGHSAMEDIGKYNEALQVACFPCVGLVGLVGRLLSMCRSCWFPSVGFRGLTLVSAGAVHGYRGAERVVQVSGAQGRQALRVRYAPLPWPLCKSPGAAL